MILESQEEKFFKNTTQHAPVLGHTFSVAFGSQSKCIQAYWQSIHNTIFMAKVMSIPGSEFKAQDSWTQHCGFVPNTREQKKKIVCGVPRSLDKGPKEVSSQYKCALGLVLQYKKHGKWLWHRNATEPKCF